MGLYRKEDVMWTYSLGDMHRDWVASLDKVPAWVAVAVWLLIIGAFVFYLHREH